GPVRAGALAGKGGPACSNWARSVWTGPRSMRMPPSTKRSATNDCWSWRPSCEARSRNCSRLREQSDQPEVPDGLVVRDEIARREDRLARLAEAKAVLEARAQERTATEQAEYEAKLAQREERERTTGRRPGGRPPTPPVPGPR